MACHSRLSTENRLRELQITGATIFRLQSSVGHTKSCSQYCALQYGAGANQSNAVTIKQIQYCRLESVHFAVLLLDNADLAEKVLDVRTLVTRQLDNLSVFGVLHHRAVAFVLLY